MRVDRLEFVTLDDALRIPMDPVYKRIVTEDETLTHDELAAAGEHSLCYSALLYASRKNAAEAQKILVQLNEKHPDHSCSFVLETRSLIHTLSREFNAAREFALSALVQNPEALFAYSILARLAIFEKKYSEAVQNYKKILDYYPQSDTAVLNLAETYFLSKNLKEAKRYIDMAKPSTRTKLYKFFLPFSYLRTRLLWIVLIIASFSNLYLFLSLYFLVTAILVYLFVKYGYKKGDLVIVRHTFYIQAAHTFFFVLAACALADRLSLIR